MECDVAVVAEWAKKLAPLCGETEKTCRTWLTAFLTAVRLGRCKGLPEEKPRTCAHAANGFKPDCLECVTVLSRREGHSQAGVYWTAGEVIELMSSGK